MEKIESRRLKLASLVVHRYWNLCDVHAAKKEKKKKTIN